MHPAHILYTSCIKAPSRHLHVPADTQEAQEEECTDVPQQRSRQEDRREGMAECSHRGNTERSNPGHAGTGPTTTAAVASQVQHLCNTLLLEQLACARATNQIVTASVGFPKSLVCHGGAVSAQPFTKSGNLVTTFQCQYMASIHGFLHRLKCCVLLDKDMSVCAKWYSTPGFAI